MLLLGIGVAPAVLAVVAVPRTAGRSTATAHIAVKPQVCESDCLAFTGPTNGAGQVAPVAYRKALR